MKMGTVLGGRLLILIPIAFCLFLLIDSPDKTVRLLAVVALIPLEQAREWLLVSGIDSTKGGKLAKDNKRWGG